MLTRPQRPAHALLACALFFLLAGSRFAHARHAAAHGSAYAAPHLRTTAIARAKARIEDRRAERSLRHGEAAKPLANRRLLRNLAVQPGRRGGRAAPMAVAVNRRRHVVSGERHAAALVMATRGTAPVVIHAPTVMAPTVMAPIVTVSPSVREAFLASLKVPSPADPVSVVSIIRPTEERLQLPSPQEVAAIPELLPSLYDKRGRLVMPAALKGSHEILLHQNEVADRDGLARVQDDRDLTEMRSRVMLVALPHADGALQVDERLPANRRFCRPWTANFLAVLARAHYARFHTPLQVNSAVRTVEIQQHLLRTNGNAAPASGDTASPHLTGQAVDVAKRGLSLPEIAWMRGYLLPLVQEGKIDVEEEFQQSCFHISVYKKYVPSGPAPETIAVTHRDRPAALAIMLHE